MNCLVPDGGSFIRAYDAVVYRSLSQFLRRAGKKCLVPRSFWRAPLRCARISTPPSQKTGSSGAPGLRRKESGGSCALRHDYATLRLAPLISGRTLKSCPDTCLAVDAESFVTKRIRYHVASGLKSHPLQKRQRMGHPRDGEFEKKRDSGIRWATRPPGEKRLSARFSSSLTMAAEPQTDVYDS